MLTTSVPFAIQTYLLITRFDFFDESDKSICCTLYPPMVLAMPLQTVVLVFARPM